MSEAPKVKAPRDWHAVNARGMSVKGGAHRDRKKEAARNQCRDIEKSVREDER